MPNAKTTQKNKKAQSITALQKVSDYMIECLILLEYDPEYVNIYIHMAQILRAVRPAGSTEMLHVIYEAMPDDDNKIDLGSRYKALLAYLDIMLDSEALIQKITNTRV